jgi:hypothetical protein
MMKPAEDETIHKILKGIIDKWRERGARETTAEGPGEESDMIETVILSPAGIASPVRSWDECTETVVLSARGEITEPSPLSPRDLGSDAVLETVALGAGGAKREPPTSPPLNEDELTVLETIILFAGMYPKGFFRTKNGPEVAAAGERKEETENGDALSETVILAPRQTNIKAKRWKE